MPEKSLLLYGADLSLDFNMFLAVFALICSSIFIFF